MELVRAGFETWNAPDMDAYRGLLDPDIVWRPPAGLAGAGAIRGSRGGHAPVEAAARDLELRQL